MTFTLLEKKTRINLIIQAVAMLMGFSTHLNWVLTHGFLSDKYYAPLFSKFFWDSLTFLDPLAALLLILKPKWGVYLTLFIIVFDILHNNIYYREELYFNAPPIDEWITKYWMILGQILFGLFVVFSFKSNLTDIKSKQI